MKSLLLRMQLLILLLLSTTMYYAQPSCPTCPTNGTGGTGTGTRPTSPIDGEIWILISVAAILVILFANNYRKKIITSK